MLGIGVLGEINIFSDNKGLCTNSSFPGSTIKKKHNSIPYHAFRWAAAAKELSVLFERRKEKMAHLLTKYLKNTKHELFSSCTLWLSEKTFSGGGG